jgi:hypothetical protein
MRELSVLYARELFRLIMISAKIALGGIVRMLGAGVDWSLGVPAVAESAARWICRRR